MQEAIRHGGRANGRPTREQIEPAALELVERHSGQILATARRYSLSPEDAEDAYQRGLEILLVKAPSVHQHDLVPWLKTVVKHEAFAIRRQRLRTDLAGDRELASGVAPATDEQAEQHERLRLGAEAMRRLKPQEVRCLLLRAEGYSYKQICDETGWTYTKVNRCITEGRKAFLARVAGIESGAECERLAPVLSRLVDGEASAEDMAALRRHLRGCLACRATLRDFREAPRRVASFVPLLAAPRLLARGLRRLGRLLGSAGVHKTAAALGVAGALAGGGVAAIHAIDHGHRPPAAAARHQSRSRPVAQLARTPIVAVRRHAASHHLHKRRHHQDRTPAVNDPVAVPSRTASSAAGPATTAPASAPPAPASAPPAPPPATEDPRPTTPPDMGSRSSGGSEFGP
jgi:RNA polymerase sigma factor (sigma-70 family)